jgi:nitrite reductase (NADH) small subunit
MTATPPTSEVHVCALADLVPERGSVALVAGAQVAIVRTHDDAVHAVDNRDPYSGAQIVARGLVGTRGEAPTVTSPMYKQVWDLRTGACLDGAGDEPIALRTWGVRVVDGEVMVST